MLTRRDFLGISLGAGASLALTPELLRALQQGKLIQRAIPSTGEMLPVVGLSFSNHPGCAEPTGLKEVLKVFHDNGGRLYDSMHGEIRSEQFHANIANELGIQNKLFWSTRGTPGGVVPLLDSPSDAFVKGQIDMWLGRIKAQRIDLVMLPPQDDPAYLTALKAEKKAGRVRYIGVQGINDNAYPRIEAVMRSEPIDFIGVDYDIGNRARVEDTILPLAQERKIGVIAFFPFGMNAGMSCASGINLFGRVGTRPLPEWAAEFDAKSWAQFFLKYVISHPAVTVARVGTTKPSHMLDNMGGGIGRLPNEAMRKRMAELIDSLPPAPRPQLPSGPPPAPSSTIVVASAILDRYVGDYETPGGTIVTVRRNGAALWVKPGTSGQAPVTPRSETRFADPRGPVIEFQVDGQGQVTGAIYEQQGPQGIQRLVLKKK